MRSRAFRFLSITVLLSGILMAGCRGSADTANYPNWQPAKHDVFGNAVIEDEKSSPSTKGKAQ